MKQRVPVSQIMTKNLETLTTNQSLYEAESLFKKHGIRHIPVVEGKNIVGVLSYSDLLKISYADVNDGEDAGTRLFYNSSSQGIFCLNSDKEAQVKICEMKSIWK